MEEYRQAKTEVHPTAIISPSAQLGENVHVGAMSVIGDNVVVGDNTYIDAHVVISCNTTIGKDNKIAPGAVLGGAPQDYKFKGEDTFLVIGESNVIREYVTVHRASGEGEKTEIGDNNMLMAYCHVGHNCRLLSGITMANNVGISGHALIEEKVVIGGMVGIHQNVRVGKFAMIGGFSKVVQDVPPYAMSDGRPARICDLNVIGLRRNDVTPKVRNEMREAYKLLYRSDLNVSQALETIKNELDRSDELDYLLDFVSNIRKGRHGRQLEAPKH